MLRHSSGIKTMVIEIILFVAFVTGVATTMVKLYEWRQVRYGPYLTKQRSKTNRPRQSTVEVIEESA